MVHAQLENSLSPRDVRAPRFSTMPEVDEGDILQRAFADVQYCYSPFGNDATAARSVPTMDGYNIMMDSQSMSSASSPMSMSLSPRCDDSGSNVLNMNDETFMNLSGVELPPAYIEILDQPVDKFRFRYKSEMMGTHGCLSSASTTSRRKRQAPTAKLVNFVGQKAKIRCTLVTSDPNRRIPHAHHLVKREGSDENDAPYEIDVSAENDFTAQFHGMGIIHTAKKHIKDELVKKMRMELLEKHRARNANIRTLTVCEETKMKMNADSAQKWMNLNSVCLCFEAFVEGPNGVLKSITERVYSNAINNLKSALTGELKICRIDKYSSPADGGEEVFMLVEKVGKKNIRVKFFETDENDREIWQGYGRFSELDVHHQYAIVFRTPPYRDLNISEPKEVFIKLERPTDGDSSDPIKFTYKPTDCLMSKKRPRISYSGSSEYQKIRQAENNVNISPSPFNNPSRSSSSELLKLIYESSKVQSEEFAKFLNAIDIDGYADTMPLNQGNDDEQMLTTDGPSSSDRVPCFAETLIRETMKRIQVEPARAKELITKMLDERTTYGDTPLHSALRHGQHEIVKYILMLSASDPDLKYLVHLKNSSGKTPLHYAVLLNLPQVVSALLALGADPNECDDRDFYPLHAAVKRPEAGACVDVLLTKELKINAQDEAGWTPLQLAVEAGSFHAVRSLVKAGADVNQTEVSYGRTALHIAVENSHVDIVKYLVEKTKVNVNQTNLGGNTALHSAVVNPSALAKEMCKILLEHGANPHIPNHIRDAAEGDEKDELAFSVKEELDDDDMGHDAGQTSFDLASNKPEILSLFNHASKGQSFADSGTITIKEEVTEEDTLTSYLDTQTRTSLAAILDKSRTWQKLAKHLECEYLLSTLDDETSSPSLTILNYADVQGTLSMNDLKKFLTEIGETEGVAFVKKVLNKRNGT